MKTPATHSYLRLLVGLALFASLYSACFAAVPPVVPLFPHNQTLVPGRLYFRQVDLQRIGHLDWHNGTLYSANVTGSPRRAFVFTNPSNPSSLSLQTALTELPWISEHDTHGHTKVGDWLGAGIKRNGVNTNIYTDYRINFDQPTPSRAVGGRTGTHTIFYPWAVPFHWSQYGESNGWAWIYRGQTLLHEWDLVGQGGILGNSILLGNILFVVSHAEATGVLALDISPIFETPSRDPVVLDRLSGNFGAYLPAIWQNYIILVRNDVNALEMIDISDPTDIRFAASIPLNHGDGNVPYVQFQDNYAFVWGNKVNLETRQVELALDVLGNGQPSSGFQPTSAFVPRPPGSASGPLDVSQYNLPLGNLVITGGYSAPNLDGIGVWAHQAAPDTKRPYVGYHIPRPGQTSFPLGAPISLVIHETLESYTIVNGDSIILRKLGTTTPIDCYTSFSHDDVLTLTPVNYLENNTTYEVIVMDGGIKDAVGNGIEPYTFTFSTGSAVVGGNASPTITSFTATPSPTTIGTTLTFTAVASDPENDTLQYRFTFGDNAPPAAWQSSNTATRAYAANGHYDVKVQVRDLKPGGSTSVVSSLRQITVAAPITGTRPTNSSTIALDAANRRVWSVNPDSDTVTVIHADTNAKLAEYNLATLLGLSLTESADPRNVALDAAGNAWITCHDADRIAVLSPTGALITAINTGYGSTPYGVVMTPDRSSAFVSLFGKGLLKRYSTATRTETGSLPLGPTPRAIAITGDGTRVLVTRFLSTLHLGQTWDVQNGSSLSLTRTINFIRQYGTDNSSNGRGVINQLAGITISPDNEWAWVTASKMNDEHGLFFTGAAATDNVVRAATVRFRLSDNEENNNLKNRIDLDNHESPTSVVFSPLGNYVFVTTQGNNEILVFDNFAVLAPSQTKAARWRFPADLAPQGAVIDPATNKLFSNNFMARNVSIHDLSNFLSSGSRTLTAIKVPAVSVEKLSAAVLTGKQIFYNASLKNALGLDAMSRDTYMSCATCHLDGAQDGRTWDFTQRGEGLRNTIDLRGRAGRGHGQIHWSGNFDEVQDFENDIRSHFGGTGLIDAPSVSGPLGSPKVGLSPKLDQLAAYVSSLNRATLPRSPHRNTDGTLTAAALAGKTVFETQSCIDCHGGTNYTNSRGGLSIVPRLENVGTLRTSSGDRMAQTLVGIDTPTLLGLHATAPYFHDGSAPTLDDVFRVAGGRVYQAEDATLSANLYTPNYININYNNSVHKNGLAEWGGTGTATFTNIEGGPTAGIGVIEIRYDASQSRTLNITVNSTPYTLTVPSTSVWMAWQRARLEGIALNPGPTNTIVIQNTGDSFRLDDITISTAADLALAQPHRRVLALGATDRNNLLAYLNQLDASSPAAPVKSSPALVAFRTAQPIPADGSQDTDTPAGDGIPNLLKYAFNLIGSSPGQQTKVTTPNATTLEPLGTVGLPLITLNSAARLEVTYVRRKASGSPGVIYRVEFNSDLTSSTGWQVNPAAQTTVTSIDSLWERVVVTDHAAFERRFARLLVSALTVDAPVIISPASTSIFFRTPFQFAVTASDEPSSYSATGLPTGLAINPTTGLISGSPAVTGNFTVNISATNSGGTTNSQLRINIALLSPIINSPTIADSVKNQPFSYQITATQFVANYTALGLPAGLSVNATSGLISGTPAIPGAYVVTLGGSNSAGDDTEILYLNVINDPNALNAFNRAVGGTSLASEQNAPSEGVAQVFDGNVNTKWLAYVKTGWLRYTFNGTTAWTITRYALVSGNDGADRDPKSWLFQGSNNDGISWVTLDTRTNEAFTGRNQRREFTVTTPGNYRSYRLLITDNGNVNDFKITQLAEFELY